MKYGINVDLGERFYRYMVFIVQFFIRIVRNELELIFCDIYLNFDIVCNINLLSWMLVKLVILDVGKFWCVRML